MRILWWSNAPWSPSGYGVQTKLFVPRLLAAGHDVAICASFGLAGGSIEWNGIRCFPGWGVVGSEAIARHSESWEADLTISLFDIWVVQTEFLKSPGMRWVPWTPVDMAPLPAAIGERMKEAAASIVFSRFGQETCHDAGLTPHYVPHGVDTKLFSPVPRREARQQLGCPEDAFVVGMVAANRDYPSRKSIPQVLEAFARFARRRKDALLYLHMTRGDEPWAGNGCTRVDRLVEHFGLTGRVIMAEDYNLFLGFPEQYMANVYSALDCLAAPSMGEGFGVPILEAQACGCPVLVGDWTSMSELCFAGEKIPVEQSEPFWSMLGGFQRVPWVSAIDAGLEKLYESRADEGLRRRARTAAEKFDADTIVEAHWKPVLGAIAAALCGNSAANKKAALLLTLLDKAPRGPVAEVGCVRSEREIFSDGFSTVYLAKACANKGLPFMSYDFDPVAVDTANRALARAGCSIKVDCRDGADALAAQQEPLAFLYLDSSDDPEKSMAQYAAAPLSPGALVVVDDAQPNGKNALGKATRIANFLGYRGLPFEIVPTEPGFAALVFCAPRGKLAKVLP